MIELLAMLRALSFPQVFNPWRDTDPQDADPLNAAADRGKRLEAHFNCSPDWLLLGEAPGYRGCHFSGVPFTSEALIMKGSIPRLLSAGRLSTGERPWSEPSASIVWSTLHECGIAERTVMWNAFAFHPYRPGNLYSNRAPSKFELFTAAHVLQSVIDHFSSARVIAVGAVAQKALHMIGIKSVRYVRHPAFGGATQFREQMRAWVKT